MWKIEGPLGEKNNSLYWDNHSVKGLAKSFGTPVYIYSEDRIKQNYDRLYRAFAKNYKNFRIYYAIKANNNISVLKILRKEGAGADCSSSAEIMFAKLAGFRKEDMLYTGNYNSDEEFSYAIKEGITLNLDDISHIKRVKRIKRQDIACIRINPGIGRGEFEQIITAGPDAKFGVPYQKAIEAYSALKKSGVKEFGIHMMTGSNIFDEMYFRNITEKLLDIAGEIAEKACIKFSFVNIGGGMGVPYKVGEKDLDIEKVGRAVTESFKEKCKEYSLGSPQLRIEPGRYLVADAGILVSRVTSIKRSYKTFIGCDAGMNTLLRPALYGAYHHILVDGKADRKRIDGQQLPVETFNVCGQVCENTDQFAKNRKLPTSVKENNLLVFMNCGAYGFAMSSQYNSRPRTAEILTSRSGARLIRKGETMKDLLNGQIF